MSEVQAKLDQLDALLEEKQFWLKVLGLWEHAKQAGYSPEQVKAFTFRPEFLTPEQKRKNLARAKRQQKPLYSDLTHHNCLRLADDSLVPIPLIERPQPPDGVKCSIKETL